MDLHAALPDRPPIPPERGNRRAVRWIAGIILALFVLGEIVLLVEQFLGG